MGHRRQQGVARGDDQSVGGEPGRLGLDACLLEPVCEVLPGRPQRVRAQRERRGPVVEASPRVGRVEAMTRQPPAGEPAGMRERDREDLKGRLIRQREVRALA